MRETQSVPSIGSWLAVGAITQLATGSRSLQPCAPDCHDDRPRDGGGRAASTATADAACARDAVAAAVAVLAAGAASARELDGVHELVRRAVPDLQVQHTAYSGLHLRFVRPRD